MPTLSIVCFTNEHSNVELHIFWIHARRRIHVLFCLRARESEKKRVTQTEGEQERQRARKTKRERERKTDR